MGSQPLVALIACLLLLTTNVPQFPKVVIAQAAAQELAQRPLLLSPTPQTETYTSYIASGGHDDVHREWSKLRIQEPTWVEAVANVPPSGITGKAWHYAKIVLKALFMNSPTRTDTTANQPKLSADLRTAINVWENGAGHHDTDAIYLLAQTNFYGNFSHPRNFKEAFRRYRQLADLDGNATAQHMLGLMYATGIGDGVERDQAKAMLYHTFAAEQGSVKSEMTLAFRYHAGIGTGRDCNKASEYYKRVADKAMRWWLSGPPGGHVTQRNNVRWIESEGGAYGEGASMSSSGPHASKDNNWGAGFDDVLEILDMRERQGDWQAVVLLGMRYYNPPRGYRRNLKKAQRQFMKIARVYWGKDGKVNSKAPKGIESYAAMAAAYIGRMFLRGEGMEQSFDKAATWFRRGVANGESYAQYHLGLMYRDGIGLPQDGTKAATYLKAASEQGLDVAQSALGVMFLDQGDVDIAYRYFELAATGGVMEAFYYLAEIINKGIGRERNCGLAVAYYKVVAEKAETLHSSLQEANAAFEKGGLERAFVASLLAAEQGYETAQANVALLLDEKTSMISLPSIPLLSNPLSPVSYHGIQRPKLLDNPMLALTYYTRSSKQANTDSLIKMGDYYLAGIGKAVTNNKVHNSSSSDFEEDAKALSINLEKASTCYTSAAETHHSAQALWNLGWMHENGVGPIPQDFHMAKRYYDLALEMNKEAYLPVKLALVKLRARSWWNGITGGKINSIRRDETASKAPKTFMEWLNRFLDAAEEMDAQEYADAARHAAGGNGDDFDIDGANPNAYGEPGMPGGDAEYYYRTRNDNDNVEGDYLDGDIDDGLVESLIIIGLAGALAMLVYARQQRQRAGVREREQREQREREDRERNNDVQPAQNNVGEGGGGPDDVGQGNAADQGGGLFPQPGEAEYANWVAGGIAH